MRVILVLLSGLFFFLPILVVADTNSQNEPIIIGLDADLSSGAAMGGESIRRGMLVAIDEINRSGGVLGRHIQVVTRDHRGIPARGVDNIIEFSKMKNLVAVVGGVHTPVALAELEAIHKHRIIYLDPWAAGTPVIDNGYQPNYAFRVSVRDEYAGAFLVQEMESLGYKRPALFLEKTGWGRSNEQAITQALKTRALSAATTEWFHWGAKSLERNIESALESNSDVILLVANSKEGIQLVRDMQKFPVDKRLPVISHWGITGGNFFTTVRKELAEIDITFLQTYSFFKPTFPDKNNAFVKNYFRLFGAGERSHQLKDIIAPVGSAHAYDLIHLLKIAIEDAGTFERQKVRDALVQIKSHKGLVRKYDPPFLPNRQDALDSEDFKLCRFDSDGAIQPVKGARLAE